MQRINIDQNRKAWVIKINGEPEVCNFDPSIRRASYFARLVLLKRLHRARRKNGLT